MIDIKGVSRWNPDEAMNQRTTARLLALSIAVGGCSSSAMTNSDPAPSQTMPPPTSAASRSPLVGAATSTPGPTLKTTTEVTTKAPPGAISIEMGVTTPPRYKPDQLTAKAGDVVFFLKNGKGVFRAHHDMVIGPELYQVLARSSQVKTGDSVLFTVQGLPAGTYRYWCEVERHASIGMVGTLTVTP